MAVTEKPKKTIKYNGKDYDFYTLKENVYKNYDNYARQFGYGRSKYEKDRQGLAEIIGQLEAGNGTIEPDQIVFTNSWGNEKGTFGKNRNKSRHYTNPTWMIINTLQGMSEYNPDADKKKLNEAIIREELNNALSGLDQLTSDKNKMTIQNEAIDNILTKYATVPEGYILEDGFDLPAYLRKLESLKGALGTEELDDDELVYYRLNITNPNKPKPVEKPEENEYDALYNGLKKKFGTYLTDKQIKDYVAAKVKKDMDELMASVGLSTSSTKSSSTTSKSSSSDSNAGVQSTSTTKQETPPSQPTQQTPPSQPDEEDEKPKKKQSINPRNMPRRAQKSKNGSKLSYIRNIKKYQDGGDTEDLGYKLQNVGSGVISTAAPFTLLKNIYGKRWANLAMLTGFGLRALGSGLGYFDDKVVDPETGQPLENNWQKYGHVTGKVAADVLPMFLLNRGIKVPKAKMDVVNTTRQAKAAAETARTDAQRALTAFNESPKATAYSKATSAVQERKAALDAFDKKAVDAARANLTTPENQKLVAEYDKAKAEYDKAMKHTNLLNLGQAERTAAANAETGYTTAENNYNQAVKDAKDAFYIDPVPGSKMAGAVASQVIGHGVLPYLFGYNTDYVNAGIGIGGTLSNISGVKTGFKNFITPTVAATLPFLMSSNANAQDIRPPFLPEYGPETRYAASLDAANGYAPMNSNHPGYYKGVTSNILDPTMSKSLGVGTMIGYDENGQPVFKMPDGSTRTTNIMLDNVNVIGHRKRGFWERIGRGLGRIGESIDYAFTNPHPNTALHATSLGYVPQWGADGKTHTTMVPSPVNSSEMLDITTAPLFAPSLKTPISWAIRNPYKAAGIATGLYGATMGLPNILSKTADAADNTAKWLLKGALNEDDYKSLYGEE